VKDNEFDRDAESDVDIFLEAKTRLTISSDASSEDRVNGINDLEFLNGSQWDDDIKNERRIDGRPSLTINHTQTYVRRIENTLKQQRPRIKCHPVGNGADVESAKIVNGLIRHIETLSNASVAYDLGGGSAIKIGWGYWRIVGEYCDGKSFDQELKIKPIRNAFTVYDDPSAIMPAGEDRSWCLISEMMKRTEYKRKYPNADNADWQGDAPGDTQGWESKEEIRLAEYYRIVEKPDTLLKLQDGSPMLKSEWDQHEKLMPGALPIAMDANGKPISRKTTRRQVQWFLLNGTKIVDRRDLPGYYIPLIRCEGNVEDVDGKVSRSGMVRDLKDPARMYNYWRTAETERYALAPKAPWVTAEGQTDGHPEWDSANQKSYSRLEYKPVTDANGNTLPPPQRQNPVQVEAGMAEAAAGAEHDLASVAGYMPENPQDRASVVSGNKYLQRRQGMADLVHWHYYDNQTYAIMFTGIMLLDLIPWYYDTPRMQRIIGDDGMPETVGINQSEQQVDDVTGQAMASVKNNLTLGKYDVVMDTGPGYQTKREESTEAVLGLLSTPLGEDISKVAADVVVRGMDFNDADVIADRLAPLNPQGMDKLVKGLPKQAQAIVQSMQQQLQQAQEQIKNMELELKYKATIEEMKDKGQTQRAHINAAAKAHDTETKAQSNDLNSQRDYEGWMEEVHINANAKKDVAEIGAAASLLNTRAEAEANDRAADKMIAAGSQDRVN
jgi:hypothetical protein